ncbi:MAG: type II secretion system protein GspM [Gammaproteobacteria bacterium]
MRAWWQARSPSERIVLGAGAAVVLAALYYVLVVEPLALERERLRVRVGAQLALNSELAAAADEARRLRANTDSRRRFTPGESILSVVNATAARTGTREFLRRINPVGAGAVSLYLDDVAFADLARWLVMLDEGHGVEVERAVLDAVRAGVVDAQLTLRARGAATGEMP